MQALAYARHIVWLCILHSATYIPFNEIRVILFSIQHSQLITMSQIYTCRNHILFWYAGVCLCVQALCTASFRLICCISCASRLKGKRENSSDQILTFGRNVRFRCGEHNGNEKKNRRIFIASVPPRTFSCIGSCHFSRRWEKAHTYANL